MSTACSVIIWFCGLPAVSQAKPTSLTPTTEASYKLQQGLP